MAESGEGFFERHPRINALVIAGMALALAVIDLGRLGRADDHVSQSTLTRATLTGLVCAVLMLVAGGVAAARMSRGVFGLVLVPMALVWLAMFIPSHRRFGPDLLDNGFKVGAATFSAVVFVVGGLVLAVAVFRRGGRAG